VGLQINSLLLKSSFIKYLQTGFMLLREVFLTNGEQAEACAVRGICLWDIASTSDQQNNLRDFTESQIQSKNNPQVSYMPTHLGILSRQKLISREASQLSPHP
jgi:hypothetical protein